MLIVISVGKTGGNEKMERGQNSWLYKSASMG